MFITWWNVNSLQSLQVPSFTFTYPLTKGAAGAPQITPKPAPSPLPPIPPSPPPPSGTRRTPGLPTPWGFQTSSPLLVTLHTGSKWRRSCSCSARFTDVHSEEYKPWKWGATARYYASHTKTMLTTGKSQPRSKRQSDHPMISWPS